MKTFLGSLLCLCISSALVLAETEVREKKMLPIFNVVRFQNQPCIGDSNRNGTCYTAEECANKGGDSSGTCANSFGVCCTFTSDTCGSTSNENCTYLVQASTTTFTDPLCTYQICRCSSDVCRMRLDFNTFSISGPAVGTAVDANNQTPNSQQIGDCITDSFSISGGTAPVICGVNSGEHMIIDASNCNDFNFNIATGVNTARAWDVKVTQYNCVDVDLAGPPGCLQYFTSNTGTIRSFNFPAAGAAVTNTATHLSDQNYDICFRRNQNNCALCFFPTINIAAPTVNTQNSFGLSESAIAGMATARSLCTSDFLEFPGTVTNVADALTTTVELNSQARVCGRIFATAAGLAAETLCTRGNPFRVRFTTDGNELGGGATSNLDETELPPAGIIGFSLNFDQRAC